MRFCFTMMFLWLWFAPAQAAIEAYEFNDLQTEESYKALIQELRCLVCQNQNLADSDADLAKDLRQQTYEMLQQGKSQSEIVEYMVARYGDFVLYRPPVKSSTYLLWLGPFVLLAGVLLMVFMRYRKPEPPTPPEADAVDRARDLLADEGRSKRGKA
jgi:cytochrome c-type biogenesis protein CcmH